MPPSSDGTTVARKELEILHAQMDSLYRQSDAPGAANLLTDSVIISPIDIPDLQGRETVEAALTDFFTSHTVSRYALQLVELDVFGDVAYGRGTYTWRADLAEGRDGGRGEAGATHGRFAAVYQRGVDGAWRLHRLIENALPAATP